MDRQTPALRAAQPFDRWLHTQLHDMYDAVAREPLPDELMDLVAPSNKLESCGTSGG